MIAPCLVEISEFKGEGYRPLVNYGEWRVAILRYIDELRPENISFFERHLETDEVFVLLQGRCMLLIYDEANIYPLEMEPQKLYNVKRDIYHSHVLSKDAVVLIIENNDTDEHNSEKLPLSVTLQKNVIDIAKGFSFPEQIA